MQEALARSQGNLDEAEQLAARDRLRLREIDDEVEEEEQTSTAVMTKPSKRQKSTDGDDPALQKIIKRMESAQAELVAVRQAMSTTEPVTERIAYLDWVKAACKDATDDQWIEFQASFGAMHARWQAEKRQRNLQQQHLYRRNLPSSTATSYCPSPTPDSFQPYSNQWRTTLPGDTSMWGSQSSQQMTQCMQQPHSQETVTQQSSYQQQQQPWSVIMRPTQSKVTGSSSTSSIIREAMETADAIDFALSTSSQQDLDGENEKLNNPPAPRKQNKN